MLDWADWVSKSGKTDKAGLLSALTNGLMKCPTPVNSYQLSAKWSLRSPGPAGVPGPLTWCWSVPKGNRLDTKEHKETH